MSRYLILVILNLPLILAGIINAVVNYKLSRTSKRRFILRLALWSGILVGLIFAQPLYNFLFSKNLTNTEPLSLFDVIQITGIVFTFFIASQAYAKVDLQEKNIKDLHQELSIIISDRQQRK